MTSCKLAARFSYTIQKASWSQFLSQWYYVAVSSKHFSMSLLSVVKIHSVCEGFFHLFPSLLPLLLLPPHYLQASEATSTRELTWRSLWARVCGEMTNPFCTFTGIWGYPSRTLSIPASKPRQDRTSNNVRCNCNFT